MSKVKERIDYQVRLNRVIGFIHDHLDEEIDLNRLADVACLSPHHWHRIYHAMHGETIAATVRRLRLHRAAGFLANTVMPIETVAEKSGYASTASFTRAFSLDYGRPPAQYRRKGGHAKFLALIAGIPRGICMDVKTLRARLAKKYKAEVTCPITTGFHLRAVAEVAIEKLKRGAKPCEVTPFWRVLDENAPTTAKLSCGPAFVKRQRKAEGI